jgi:ABC-type Fe3+/spermidine/putrescine transport system ATPase subunit
VPLEVPEDADAPVRDSIEPGPAWLMLRPQAVRLVPSETNGQGGPQGIVADLAYRGTTYTYTVAIDEMAEPLMAEIAVGAHEPIEVGDRVEVRWEPGAARLVRSTTVTDPPGKESST